MNATDKCVGTITRIRNIKNKTTGETTTEKSVIDFFIVCQRFYDLILSMKIDEDRLHVLTKYAKTASENKESDHNPLICNVNIPWTKPNNVNKRLEIIDYKNGSILGCLYTFERF